MDEKAKTISKDLLEIPEIAQALELAEESAYTPGELSLYESYWDQVSREKTLMSGKYVEGKAAGKAEGEASTKIEVAKKMIQLGVALDIIVQATSLTQEEIKAVIENEAHTSLEHQSLDDVKKH